MITADGKAWAKSMADAQLIDQLPLSHRAAQQVHQSAARQATNEVDALLAEMRDRGMCSVCVQGYMDGDQEADEIRTGEECRVCGESSCESHGKTFDTRRLSGWAHEACKDAI